MTLLCMLCTLPCLSAASSMLTLPRVSPRLRSASHQAGATSSGIHITKADSGLWQDKRGIDRLSAKLISWYTIWLTPLAISHMAPRAEQQSLAAGNQWKHSYESLPLIRQGRLRVILPVPQLSPQSQREKLFRTNTCLSHLWNNTFKLPYLLLCTTP